MVLTNIAAVMAAAEAARLDGQLLHAYELLHPYADQESNNPLFRFELALTLDAMDKELEAIPHYEMALSAGLTPDKRAAALLCLGSSLRNVGRLEQAKLVLKEAVHEFPDHIGIRCFYALAQYSGGEPAESVRTLLHAILVIAPESVRPYAAGLRHYAQQLSQAEPPQEK